MGSLEDAVRVEVAAVGWSALGELALGLARRLDAGPGDREAAVLSRELRLVLGACRAAVGPAGELEEWLAGIGTEAFGRG